jgi:hypothetical protein
MTNLDRIYKVGAAVGAILFVFLVALTIKEFKSIAYVGKDRVVTNSISVNGRGEAVAIPDIATFTFTVEENAATVAAAQEEATERINAAIAAMREGGVEERDIKTVSYNISPHYEYSRVLCTATYCPPTRQTLTGYDVSQTIQIKVRDLSKAGALFTSIGSLGVQNVGGLSFEIDDIESVKADARAEAIEDAQAKAEELAKQLGVRLVRIMSYYDQSDNPYIYGRGGDAMLKAESSISVAALPPEVPTGEQEIVSSVTITYEIR